MEKLYLLFFCPEGKMGRRNFAISVLGSMIFAIIFSIFLPIMFANEEFSMFMLFYFLMDYVFLLFLIGIVQTYALRRWHDIGKDDTSFMLFTYMPVAFWLSMVIIILSCLGSMNVDDIVLSDEGSILLLILTLLLTIYTIGFTIYLLIAKGEGKNTWYAQISSHPIVDIPIKSIFSFQGRLNRKRFILRLAGLTIVSSIISILTTMTAAGTDDLFVQGLLLILASVIPIFFSFTLYAQRLHDMNKSVVPFCITAIALVTFQALSQMANTNSSIYGVLYGISLFIFMYFVGKMIFEKGTPEENPYGTPTISNE